MTRALNPDPAVFRRERGTFGPRDTQREEGREMTEIDMEVMQLQGPESQEPPESGGSWEGVLPRREGPSPADALTSDFSFQNRERIIHFCCSKPPSLWSLFWQP